MYENQLPGLAFVVLKEGDLVPLEGVGEASPGEEAVTPETEFILGSVSKSFTALAVSQLVDQGKPDLQASYQQYVPNFALKDKNAAATIPVAQLVHHKSGLSQTHSYSTTRRTQTLEERMLRLGQEE